MKISGPQIGGILRDPGRFLGILLHGDDPGLVRERALALVRVVAGSIDDPFRSCVLTREEHGRLSEEASSSSLMGGRRVVRLLDAGDGLAVPAARLDANSVSGLVVLEAGALQARSKLRQMAEKSPAWASLACYPASGAALASDIRQTLEAAGFAVTGDALALLERELASDTTTRRSELEKLATFASGARVIDLDMAAQCCAPPAEAASETLLYAVMAGDVLGTSRYLLKVVEEATTGPGLIIGLIGRAQRLLKVRLQMLEGRTAEEAIQGLMPPVYFRDTPAMLREARLWTESALLGLLADARVADLACKRAGSHDVTIASQLLLTIARRAARVGRAS